MDSVLSLLLLVAQIIVVVGSVVALIHFSLMVIAGFSQRSERTPDPGSGLHYAFLVPCMNEELVVDATIRRLLDHPDNASIYIIDDGSVDQTRAIAQAHAAENGRVHVFERTLPNAQQGKGEALNACYRQVVHDYKQAGVDPTNVIICIMDADGLLDTNALEVVSPWFTDPKIGGVQIAVRIINRWDWRALLQDVDFFMFGQILQRGRNRVGSVGLGGNGQFTRLSAMMDLGDKPWTDCLTEDLDLGLQMMIHGWRNAFTAQTAVHQQGLVDVGKLVRQRTRWIQGQFQCWNRIPALVGMRARWYTKADLVFHLTWPVMSCLLFPVAVLTSWPLSVYQMLAGTSDELVWFLAAWLTYALGFGPNLLVAFFYRSKSEDMTVRRTLMLAHVMPIFQYMLLVAGWRSVGRLISGKKSWAKTERLVLPTPIGGNDSVDDAISGDLTSAAA